jgi:hypothetical protein
MCECPGLYRVRSPDQSSIELSDWVDSTALGRPSRQSCVAQPPSSAMHARPLAARRGLEVEAN